MSDFRVLFFTFIPQGLATFFIGMALVGLREKATKVILFGILYGVLDYIGKNAIMAIHGPDLIGNLIPIIFQFIVLRFVFKVKIGISIACILLSNIVQLVGNFITVPILNMLHISVEVLSLIALGKIWQLVMVGLYINIPLYILCLIEIIKPFAIFNISKRNGMNI